MRLVRIDIAVGQDALTAVVRTGTTSRLARVQLVDRVPDAEHDSPGPATSLASAFVLLRDQLTTSLGRPLDGARIRIAVLPPLVSARLIELPPLGPAEAESVIRRGAQRHFPLGTESRVISVREPAGGARQSRPLERVLNTLHRPLRRFGRRVDKGEAETATAPGNWLAFSAAAGWLDGLRTAIEGVGWRVDAIVPAHTAWLAAAEASSTERPLAAVIAVEGGTAHIMQLAGTSVLALRRIPGGDPATVADLLGPGSGTVALYADRQSRPALRAQLAAQGWAVSGSDDDDSAARIAAEFAHAATSELVSPAFARARRHSDRRLALRLGAAAVVLLLAAAGLELWGTHRDLARIRAERAAIFEEVQPIAEIRDSLYAYGARMQAVTEIDGSTPRWTPVLVELAKILPRDTHIQRLHARGDTVTIQLVSGRAGPALASLREARTLRAVELYGVVDRELDRGTTTAERFTISALLVPDPGGTDDSPTRPDGGEMP